MTSVGYNKEKKMKQGKLIDIIKYYIYECPTCSRQNKISSPVWEKTDNRRCSRCSKLFRTDPDYGQDMNKPPSRNES